MAVDTSGSPVLTTHRRTCLVILRLAFTSSFYSTSFLRAAMTRRMPLARAATNELGPAYDRCEHRHLSLIDKIKAIYLTGLFLIAYMEVRYFSPLSTLGNTV